MFITIFLLFVFIKTPISYKPRLYGYAPDGMTPEQYKELINRERNVSFKNINNGPRGFKSRSLESFQLALEKGEAEHLMPVNPEDVRSGKIPIKDVPYMQRGGRWDNKDIVRKRGWQNSGFGMKVFNDGKAKILKKNKYDVPDGKIKFPWAKKDNNKNDVVSKFGSKLTWNYKPPKIQKKP